MIARYLVAYVGAGVVMIGLDAAWISLAGARLYRPELHAVLTEGFRPAPAIVFYLIYLLGVSGLAVAPAMRAGRWPLATALGALLGLCAYGTYDLTNQATLITWSMKVTLFDLAWGTILTAAAATAGYFASRLMAKPTPQ